MTGQRKKPTVKLTKLHRALGITKKVLREFEAMPSTVEYSLLPSLRMTFLPM